jgi:hypothetical protein
MHQADLLGTPEKRMISVRQIFLLNLAFLAATAGQLPAQGVSLADYLPAETVYASIVSEPLLFAQRTKTEAFFSELADFPVADLVCEAVASGSASEDTQRTVSNITKGMGVLTSRVDWKVLAGREVGLAVWGHPGDMAPELMLISKLAPGTGQAAVQELHRLCVYLAALTQVRPQSVLVSGGTGEALVLPAMRGMKLSWAVKNEIAVVTLEKGDLGDRLTAAPGGPGHLGTTLAGLLGKTRSVVPVPLHTQYVSFDQLANYIQYAAIGFMHIHDRDIPAETKPQIRYYVDAVLKVIRGMGQQVTVLDADNGGINGLSWWRLQEGLEGDLADLLKVDTLPEHMQKAIPSGARKATVFSLEIVPDLYNYVLGVLSADPRYGATMRTMWLAMLDALKIDPEKDIFSVIGKGLVTAEFRSGAPASLAGLGAEGPVVTADTLPHFGFILDLANVQGARDWLKRFQTMAESRNATDPMAPTFVVDPGGNTRITIGLPGDQGLTSAEYAIEKNCLVLAYPDSFFPSMMMALNPDTGQAGEAPWARALSRAMLPAPVFVSVSDLGATIESASQEMNSLSALSSTLGGQLEVAGMKGGLNAVRNALGAGRLLLEALPPMGYSASVISWDQPGDGYLGKWRVEFAGN